MTDDERMMKETGEEVTISLTKNSSFNFTVVAKFAQEKIAPKVKEMEELKKQDPDIIKALFENGLMGIQIPEEYGGSGSNFMTTILAIEELSKVDSNISVFVDIQNTLVNALMIRLGTPEQKAKYLPRLATQSVRNGLGSLMDPVSNMSLTHFHCRIFRHQASAYPSPHPVPMLLL